MIGSDCQRPAELLYLKRNYKKNFFSVLLDFYSTSNSWFLWGCNDTSKMLRCTLLLKFLSLDFLQRCFWDVCTFQLP